jgi:hypothetical protein
VPAFWAGDATWRVRYASPPTGTHRYRTECSDADWVLTLERTR